MVNESVTNWSSTRKTTRFDVSVGVAYGSDTNHVKTILLQAAGEVSGIKKHPLPQVRFVDFGNSSLDFVLMFFSDRIVTIEAIKSNLRFKIDELFRENQIEVPFPQRDIWIKNKESQ